MHLLFCSLSLFLVLPVSLSSPRAVGAYVAQDSTEVSDIRSLWNLCELFFFFTLYVLDLLDFLQV